MVRHIALPGLLILIPLIASAQTPPADQNQGPVIITRGEGEVRRAPDQAWVTIAAETRANTPGEAQRQAAEAMTAVQAALQKTGLPPDAIKTTAYSLRPDTEWVNGRARIRGYIATNQIEVRVDVLDRLGAVLDAAGSSGATSIAGIRFDLRDRAAAEREALRLAVEDALARARAMASGARANVGPILRLEEQMEFRPPMPVTMRMADASAAQETPITPGEVEIRATVMATVAIR
jgi:uncharacterized protein YggE